MNKITKSFVKKNYPLRTSDSHKNLNGRVLIAAGSRNMPGAAILAATACYRAGAGLVTLAVPACIASLCAQAMPEAIILQLEDSNGCLNKKSLKTLLNYLKQMPHNVLLVGPGMDGGAKITADLLTQTKLPAVIDADALNFLAQYGPQKLNKNIPYILTPHEGEIKRLLNKKTVNRLTAAQELFELTGAVSLLKGPRTKVCFDNITYDNTTGNEGLAKAGSGDTLAGIIAAVFAQLLKREDGKTNKQKAFAAACLGVFMHGAAADDAVKEYGKISLLASDVCAQLPYTIKEILG